MKILRLNYLLTLLLLFVSFATYAQRNVYVWRKSGDVTVLSSSEVDSVTFSVGEWLYAISTSPASTVTERTFEAKTSVKLKEGIKSLSVLPTIGVCYSTESDQPTVDNASCKKLGNEVGTYDISVTGLLKGNKYYYRTYVKLLDNVFYGDVQSVTTLGEKENSGANNEPNINYGLPIISIYSDSITSKDDYVEGATCALYQDGLWKDYGEMKIKGRGNSTWLADKKPYKMKFPNKVSFVGEVPHKEWVLLANYFDKSMVRTSITYYMADSIGNFNFVPQFLYTDLLHNGTYKGTYQLGDQVRIEKGRVLNGDDGFLLEVDYRATEEAKLGEAVIFEAPHLINPINIKDIKVGDIDEVVEGDENYTFIKNFVTNAANVLYSDEWLDSEKGYKSLIDADTFVEWYLINEITKNNDACFFSSCYMTLKKGEGEKLNMGPLWDYDLAFGVPDYNDMKNPTGFWIKQSGWYPRFFQDPEFVNKVKSRFNDYYNKRNDILAHIDATAKYIENSAIANNKVWGVLCDKDSEDAEVRKKFYDEVDYVKNYFSTRLEWLKSEFDKM